MNYLARDEYLTDVLASVNDFMEKSSKYIDCLNRGFHVVEITDQLPHLMMIPDDCLNRERAREQYRLALCLKCDHEFMWPVPVETGDLYTVYPFGQAEGAVIN